MSVDTIRRLRDAADLSEKGLPFVEGDDDLVADIEEDIALEREAADALEALQSALVLARETINGLADQQAMPDDFYRATLARIDEVLAS